MFLKIKNRMVRIRFTETVTFELRPERHEKGSMMELRAFMQWKYEQSPRGGNVPGLFVAHGVGQCGWRE